VRDTALRNHHFGQCKVRMVEGIEHLHIEGERDDTAIATDALRSIMCAYLAVISLIGLSVNAVFHVARFDAVAALIAVPILLDEGRALCKGQTYAG